jgi:acetylornithine deacetylase/succinyl-diaminopimelate desuccinylase-like protein
MLQLPFSKTLNTLAEAYLSLDTSQADGGSYPAAIKLLGDFLESIGFETEVVKMPKSVTELPNRQHLIARRFTDSALPTLLIYNHIDVVPAPYADAFLPRIVGEKLFARGACDHKGSTLAVLSALEKLQKAELRFNLIFIATTDEETGQLEQLRYLTTKLQLPSNTLVFDPDTLAGGVSVATLGLAQLEVTLQGNSVHSGVSHLGVNAVEQAGKLLEFFATEKTRQERQISKFPSFPSTGIDQICARCNVNMISGGTAPNVVPDTAILTVDYRFIPEQDVTEELKQIQQRLKVFCQKQDLKYSVSVLSFCESYATEHPEVERLGAVLKSLGADSGAYGVLGSTHAAQWCKELALAHFGVGVARGDTRMHGINEFAYLEDIELLEKVMVQYLTVEAQNAKTRQL